MSDVFKIIKKTYPCPDKILLIGCGGTGGYVVGPLARTIGLTKKNIKLIIADGDTVEEKNLLRQNFIFSDVGRNKAEVLAERYSSAFGVEIFAVSKDITEPAQIETHLGLDGLVIGCVDNNASRIVINNWYNKYNFRIKVWIDSGNEETNGQVVMGVRNCGKNQPCAFQVYPNLKIVDKFNHEKSCAERAISSPQNIQTNITASNIILNYLNLLLFDKQISSFAVEFGINNTYKTKFNLQEEYEKINFYEY